MNITAELRDTLIRQLSSHLNDIVSERARGLDSPSFMARRRYDEVLAVKQRELNKSITALKQLQ